MSKYNDLLNPLLSANPHAGELDSLLGKPAEEFNPAMKSGRSPVRGKQAAPPEPPKTRAELLFQGQKHPKKQKKIIRLEQWVEVRIDDDGKVTTTLYPPNAQVIERGQRMLPPPEFVYRRINFPDGIPHEYDWTGVQDETHRKLGGCCIQRMTVNTWLDLIDEEAKREDGHISPTPVMTLPRAHGNCKCDLCTQNQKELDRRETAARAAGKPVDLDFLLRYNPDAE